MNDKERYVEKNNVLIREFDKYILEHPEFSDHERKAIINGKI